MLPYLTLLYGTGILLPRTLVTGPSTYTVIYISHKVKNTSQEFQTLKFSCAKRTISSSFWYD